jgi:hypothetical protein
MLPGGELQTACSRCAICVESEALCSLHQPATATAASIIDGALCRARRLLVVLVQHVQRHVCTHRLACFEAVASPLCYTRFMWVQTNASVALSTVITFISRQSLRVLATASTQYFASCSVHSAIVDPFKAARVECCVYHFCAYQSKCS